MGTVLKTFFVLLVCYSAHCYASAWENKQAEVYFMLDSSSSVWVGDYFKMTNMVADIVSDMDIGPDKTRVGVGVFADVVQQNIDLTNSYNKTALVSAIRTTPKIQGDADVSRAIMEMRQIMSTNNTRPNVPRVCVFFTDSTSRNIFWAYRNASEAKNEGIFLFVVGIGDKIHSRELWNMASEPKNERLFYLSNFNKLASIRWQLSANMAKVNLYVNDVATCGKNNKMDIMFVYEEYALGAKLTASVRKFLKEVTDQLSINPGNVRVGKNSKTCQKGGQIRFNNYFTREDFMKAVDEEDTGEGIVSLITETKEKFFNAVSGRRDYAKQIMVVILSRPIQPFLQNFIRAMLIARYADIDTYIIRQGTNYNKMFLQRVLTHPSHAVFSDIDKASGPFLEVLCRGI